MALNIRRSVCADYLLFITLTRGSWLTCSCTRVMKDYGRSNRIWMLEFVDTCFEPSNVIFKQLGRTSSRPVRVFAIKFTMSADTRPAYGSDSVAFLRKVSARRITHDCEIHEQTCVDDNSDMLSRGVLCQSLGKQVEILG